MIKLTKTWCVVICSSKVGIKNTVTSAVGCCSWRIYGTTAVCVMAVILHPWCVSCRKTTKQNLKGKKKAKEDKKGSKLQPVSKSWIRTDCVSWGWHIHTEEQKNEDRCNGEGRKVFLMLPSGWRQMFTCKKVSTEILVEDSWMLLIEAEDSALAINDFCFWTVVQK